MNAQTPTVPDILSRYAALIANSPNLRARDAAERLRVSEGELLAAQIGPRVVRLSDDIETILTDIKALGRVMALTRNDHCVHERKGVYDNAEFSTHGPMRHGLFVNPDIDLRLFMSHWVHAFAVDDSTPEQRKKSLQFFDTSGTALHKVYLTPESDDAAYAALVARHQASDQLPGMCVTAYPPANPDRPDADIDWGGLRTAWENLQDTHDFYPMLRRFKVGRLQALRHIGADFARRVRHDGVIATLEAARDRMCPIMVFVGNRGCIQIHTGPVSTLKAMGHWYNVMDADFNLHLRMDRISSAWVVRKPTIDGIVTALEVFDAHNGLIVTFFGARKPGIPELGDWREITAALPDQEPVHA